MHSNFMMKLMNILPILGANGPGKADGSGSGVNLASGIAEFIAGLAQVLSGLVSLVWGWLMTALYFVIKLVLNVMDVLQFFVNKLVGIDIYNNPDWADVVTFKDSDMIIKLITSETVLKLFRSVLIFSAVLLILFCIIAIIKSNFSSAMGNEEEKEGHAQKVMKKAAKSIFMCFLVPFILIIGILGSNVVLASICNAIKGNNDLTIGGIIFTTSSYDANKYRVYAKADQRVPIYYEDATEIVNPQDYRSDEDMRALFYYMAKGDVYIWGISEKMEEKKANGEYDAWYDHITGIEKEQYSGYEMGREDVGTLNPVSFGISAASDLIDFFKWLFSDETGNGTVATAFEEDFRDWYAEYFLNTPLNDMNLTNSVVRNIYSTNWYRNWTVKSTSAEFGSTYYVAGDNVYFNSTGASVDILANSASYQGYESFVTQQVEYFVMADLLDYAIEHNKEFYFVNADNTFIQWSDIQIGEDAEDKININEYADNYAVFSYAEDGVVNYYTYYGSLNEASNNFVIINGSGAIAPEDNNKLVKRVEGQTVTYTKAGKELTLLSTDSFYVSYYDGTNRLYWSEDDKNSERDGATYIICTRNEAGYFVPVTQTTTSFKSNFLNSTYGGPIVARGIFDKTSVFPQEYQQPTAIREQLVDDEGNEVEQLDPTDSKSLKIVYSVEGNPVSGSSLSNFIGYTHGTGETLIETMETPIIVGNDNMDEMVRGSISNLTVQQAEDSAIISIGSGDYEKLYVNRYVKGYTLVGDSLKLYDNQGYAMTWGGSEGNDYLNEYEYAVTEAKDVYLYYIATKGTIYQPIISYEDLDSGLLGDFWETLTETNARGAHVYGLDNQIVIKYKAKLISFMPNGMKTKLTEDGADEEALKANSMTMLVGAEAVGISQLGYNNGSFVTSGMFEVPSFARYLQITIGNLTYNNSPNYNIPLVGDSVVFYKTQLTNLYIKNGEVYYGDGDLYFGAESATELFDKYSSSYTTYSKFEVANIAYDILYGANASLISNHTNNYKSALTNAIGVVTDVDEDGVISPKDIYDHLNDNATIFTNVRTVVYSIMHGQDFLIGLASGVQKLDSYYIGYENRGDDVVVSVYAKNSTLIEESTVSVPVDASGNPILDAEGNPLESRVNINDITNTIKGDNYSYGRETKTVTMPLTVFLRANSDTKVEAVLVNSTESYYDSDNAIHKFTLTFDVTFVKAGGYAFGGAISNMNLAIDDMSRTQRQYIKVKNGAIYCDSLSKYVLTIDALKQYAVESLRGNIFGVSDFDGIFDFHTLAEADNRYIYFERGNFGYNLELDFTFHAKTVLVLPSLVIRFHAQLVRTYAIEVLYRLEGGGFLLNYNFNENTGIAIGNLFEMRNMNPLIFVFATGLIFSMLWNMVWALIQRIYVIGIRFIILPGVLAVDVLDDGKFKSWKDAVIENIFAAYSTLIMLNLYFALIPSISELTAGLITWEDLPSTFTGLFANIGVGASNMGLSVGNMVGSIGSNLTSFASSIVPQLLDLSQATIITITDWLNRLIFMMFFLVLTTLVKQGKDLLGDFVGSKTDLVKEGGDVRKEVKGLQEDVKKGPVGKLAQNASNLAIAGMKKSFTGLKSILAGSARAGGGATRSFTSLDASGGGVGSLRGSSHVTSAPTSVSIRGGGGSRYGAGGRAIPISTDEALLGAGGGARTYDSEPETRDATVFDNVSPSMSQVDEPHDVEAPRPTAYYGGGGTVDGMSFDIEPEKLAIDWGMSSTQLYDKANEHSESASTNRGQAEAARELAEVQQEQIDKRSAERDDLLAQVEALEEQIAEAKVIAGKAYELRDSARKNGQRTDKVVDSAGSLGNAGAVVDANKIWETTRADINKMQETLDVKKGALSSAEEKLRTAQEEQEILIAKAEQFESEAERDDRFHAEYLEAAQQKEQEEAVATQGDLNKLRADIDQRIEEVEEEIEEEIEEIEVPVDDLVTNEQFSNLKNNIGNQAAHMYGEIDDLSEVVQTKADAEATEKAIDTKADAGVVADIANAAGAGIATKGKHEGDVVGASQRFNRFGVFNGDDDDDPDDDPNGGGGRFSNLRQRVSAGINRLRRGPSSNVENSATSNTDTTAGNSENQPIDKKAEKLAKKQEKQEAKLAKKIEKGKEKAQAKREAELEKEAKKLTKEREKQERAEERKIERDAYWNATKEGISNVGSTVAGGIKAGANAVASGVSSVKGKLEGAVEDVSQKIDASKAEREKEKAEAREAKAQAKEEALIEEIERSREKAEAKREAELEKEAKKLAKEREKQERADERKLERDAYMYATKEGITDFGSTIADGVKTGAEAVKNKVDDVSQKIAQAKEDKLVEKIEKGKEKAQAKREAELEKEAKRQIKERERQAIAESKKEMKEAYKYAIGQKFSEVSGAVKSTVQSAGNAIKTGAQTVSTKVQRAYENVKAGALDKVVEVGEDLIMQDEALLKENEEKLKQAEARYDEASKVYFDQPAETMSQEEINAERAQLGEKLTVHDEQSRQLFAMNARIAELSEASENVKQKKKLQAELEQRRKDESSYKDQFQMAIEQMRAVKQVPQSERTTEYDTQLDKMSKQVDEILDQIEDTKIEIASIESQINELPPMPEGVSIDNVKSEFFKAVKERDKYEKQVAKSSDPETTAKIKALDEAQAILDARDEAERVYEEAMDAMHEAMANRNRVSNRLERERELVQEFSGMKEASENLVAGYTSKLSELDDKKKK